MYLTHITEVPGSNSTRISSIMSGIIVASQSPLGWNNLATTAYFHWITLSYLFTTLHELSSWHSVLKWPITKAWHVCNTVLMWINFESLCSDVATPNTIPSLTGFGWWPARSSDLTVNTVLLRLRQKIQSGSCFFNVWGGVRLSPLGTSVTILTIIPTPNDR
jgi:hypothetical protein